jgi:signal transduction histidine kinase
MKSIFTTTLLLFFITITYAQKPSQLDSLKKVLANLPAEGKSFTSDTLRVRVLCEIGESLIHNDSALLLSEKAIGISTENQFVSGLAKAHFIHAKRLKKKFFLFKAEEEFFKSLSYSLKVNDNELIGFTYLNIGDIYNISNRTNEAISYYNKAKFYYNKANSKIGLLYYLNNTGIAYFRQKKIDLSENFHKECLKKCIEFSNKEFLLNCYVNLGDVAEQKKEYNKAIYFFNYLLNKEESGNKNSIEIQGEAYNGLSSVNLKLRKLPLAKLYALKGLNLGAKITNKSYINLSKILIQIYEKEKDFGSAFHLTQKLIKKMEEQNAIEIERRLKTAQFEYDLQKQTEETQITKTKNNWMILMLGVLSLGTGFIIWNLFQIKKKNKEILYQKEMIIGLNTGLESKVLARTAELRMVNEELIRKNDEITEALFKGQTIERKRLASELHNNLGSTLSALKWRLGVLNIDNLSHKEKDVYISIKAMMDNAYADVRNISHNLLPAEFESKGLIGAIKKMVEEVNHSERFKISFDSYGTFDNIDKKIALELYSISLELINNVIKHSQATEASIFIENNETLILIISDNGKGIPDKKLNSNSFGFNDMKNRIRNLSGVLDIKNTLGKGLSVTISIPPH